MMGRDQAYSDEDSQRLMRMIEDGERLDVIASTLHRSVNSVQQKATALRKINADLPRNVGTQLRVVVSLSGGAMAALRLQAQTRNLSVSKIASQLLTVIAHDDLFRAVLGDEERNDQ